MIAAQLEYHKKAYEILSELAPVVDGLQVEQEVCPETHTANDDAHTSIARLAIGRAAKALEYQASRYQHFHIPFPHGGLSRWCVVTLGGPECRR